MNQLWMRLAGRHWRRLLLGASYVDLAQTITAFFVVAGGSLLVPIEIPNQGKCGI